MGRRWPLRSRPIVNAVASRHNPDQVIRGYGKCDRKTREHNRRPHLTNCTSLDSVARHCSRHTRVLDAAHTQFHEHYRKHRFHIYYSRHEWHCFSRFTPIGDIITSMHPPFYPGTPSAGPAQYTPSQSRYLPAINATMTPPRAAQQQQMVPPPFMATLMTRCDRAFWTKRLRIIRSLSAGM